MSQTLLDEPLTTAVGEPPPVATEPRRSGEPDEPGIILGRPLEDRSFEILETSLGMVAGLAIGTVVAGPIGTAVGGIVGAAAGLVTGEVIERAVGSAATTTDTDHAAGSWAAEAGAASSSRATTSARAARPRAHDFITYPTNLLLAVADRTAEASGATARLWSAGISLSDVVVAGPGAGDQLGRLGPRRGPLSGLVRLVQFTTMDQMPDFRVYEAALLDGRSVVGVRVVDAAGIATARQILLANGLHFLNFFGRWSTTEVSPWRGPELDLPESLRR